MRLFKQISLLLLVILLISDSIRAQDKWYSSSSMQIVGSEYQDGSKQTSLFFYNGIRYQSRNYYLSLSVPLVLGSNNSFTQTDNSFIPKNSNEGHMGGSGDLSSTSIGIGDLYINGSMDVLKESNVLPNISVDGYVKVPTASSNLGIGTGEFDSQLALGFRKYFNRVTVFAQFGYLFIGDIAGTETTDPFTINAGIGYLFEGGKHSILFAYDSYTTIIQGTDSPKQVALGYNYLINRGLFFTTIISAGLNSSTSDYTVSGGVNYEI